jgi:hypothetical protein
LLTLSAIFLCGIVVTYVGNAADYKELYDTEGRRRRDAMNKQSQAEQLLSDEKDKFKKIEDDLKARVAGLTTELDKLRTELRLASTQKTSLDEKVQSWVAITQDLTKTNQLMQDRLTSTQAELKDMMIQQKEQGQKLEETATTLIAQMGIVDTLERDKRRLEEERTMLQKQLNQLLAQYGREAAYLPVVTPEPATAAPAAPVVPTLPRYVKEIGLKGAITGVDLNNKIAQISIGAVNDVRKDMKFYVTRGDEFVCELLIFFVDKEAAVGQMLNVVYPPKVGDTVATNI